MPPPSSSSQRKKIWMRYKTVQCPSEQNFLQRIYSAKHNGLFVDRGLENGNHSTYIRQDFLGSNKRSQSCRAKTASLHFRRDEVIARLCKVVMWSESTRVKFGPVSLFSTRLLPYWSWQQKSWVQLEFYSNWVIKADSSQANWQPWQP